MNIKGKRMLVTGGAGFIGSFLVKELIKQGAVVSIIDNLCTGKKENVHPEAKFYEMNMASPDVEEVFKTEKPEIIYHFAFNVLVPKSVENPLMDMDSIAGSINILQNAKNHGAEKIIFASSGFVYGNTEKLPVKETDPVDLVNPYAIAKYAVENYLRFYKETYGLAYVSLRNAAIYGPGQVTGAMADYMRKLRAGQQADIWGDGSKTRDYVHVDDVVKANLLCLDLPADYSDPVFNIGTGKETTLVELYGKIAEILGKEASPIFHPDRPGEQMRYCLDNTKAKESLGWQPEISLEEGLKNILK